MRKEKKLKSEERRAAIVEWLKKENAPLKGSDLAKRAGVSRQVVVQDMSLLKAKGEPIFATAQGYMYLAPATQQKVQRLIAVQHRPEDTREELYTFVDHGLTVINVSIEHAIYGELTGAMHISNRQEVDAFCATLAKTKASLLSELTEGVHLHLVEGLNEAQVEKAIAALREKAFLLEE